MNILTNTWVRAKELYQTRLEPENTRALAELLWRLLLGMTLFGIMCVLAFGVWEFFRVLDTLSGAQGPSATPPVALDRFKLESVLDSYSDREAAFRAAQKSTTSFTDPSR